MNLRKSLIKNHTSTHTRIELCHKFRSGTLALNGKPSRHPRLGKYELCSKCETLARDEFSVCNVSEVRFCKILNCWWGSENRHFCVSVRGAPARLYRFRSGHLGSLHSQELPLAIQTCFATDHNTQNRKKKANQSKNNRLWLPFSHRRTDRRNQQTQWLS